MTPSTKAALDALERLNKDACPCPHMGREWEDIAMDTTIIRAALLAKPDIAERLAGALRSIIEDADFDQQAYDDGKYGGCFGYTDKTKSLIKSGNEALAAYEKQKGTKK